MNAETTLHPTPPRRPVVAVVVQHHAEETAMLRHVRSVLVRAPHVRLLQLGRLDERIAAHLDGLAVAGDAGTALLVAALERPGAGEVFALGVRSIEQRDAPRLEHLLALGEVLPEAWRGLASAFGWVPAPQLQGHVAPLLAASSPQRRELALVACRLHRVDPGAALDAALADPDEALRAQALRCAGALGRVDLRHRVVAAIADAAPAVACRAAWAACLLGERGRALPRLTALALDDGPQAAVALEMALLAAERGAAQEIAQSLSAAAQARPGERRALRRLIQALGLLGDPRFVPWLIERMDDPALARLAGEALSWISGADLARQDLETLTPPPLSESPSDDPEDDDVALDADDSLPWPDPQRLRRWWEREQSQLGAAEPPLFLGRRRDVASLRLALADGTQRQRALAALALCLLQPGQRLFPVAAPAWRQKRWLGVTGL
ncbi:MAG: TIGR02270 family protein [Burkholderiales bacterium]|nr:TIGR02270 family protein [Burkholderiales bacterium]